MKIALAVEEHLRASVDCW